jgi:hypothetical protein
MIAIARKQPPATPLVALFGEPGQHGLQQQRSCCDPRTTRCGIAILKTVDAGQVECPECQVLGRASRRWALVSDCSVPEAPYMRNWDDVEATWSEKEHEYETQVPLVAARRGSPHRLYVRAAATAS